MRRVIGRCAALLGLSFGLALLTACGFQLQGSRDLPYALQRVFIDSDSAYTVDDPPVAVALGARLRRQGATVTGDRGRAHSVLVITEVEERSEVLSIDQQGRAIEFDVIVSATYLLRSNAGEILVKPETLTARRALSFPSEQILPKEAEEARLREFLQGELAELILLQLQARLDAYQAPEQPAPSS